MTRPSLRLRTGSALIAAALWMLCSDPARLESSASGEAENRSRTGNGLKANFEAFLKYNSNLTLQKRDEKGAFISELTGRADLNTELGRGWSLEVQLSSLANLHQQHTEENWYFTRGRLGLRRALGAGRIDISSESRYFTEPDNDDCIEHPRSPRCFDFFRNVTLLTYRRQLSTAWRLRGGYENVVTRYPQNRKFDYTVNGGFAELRTRWSQDLSSYYLFDMQKYSGAATRDDAITDSSPKDGQRVSLRLGFDWLLARHSLSGTYLYQNDEAEVGVQQIGGFEGREESQDSEAEFDLYKHKATLLYSVPLSRRWVFSNYNEFIIKNFDDDADSEPTTAGRKDTLFLSSTYLRYKVSQKYALKFRYLFRMNESSNSAIDYRNHIVSMGVDVKY